MLRTEAALEEKKKIAFGLSLKYNLIQGLFIQKNMKPSHYDLISAGDLMKK